ncbi:hypothetical protein AAW14_00660 [Streptomyces hygroscopicus]|nr:hypothetical protein [Streptomyces hygroscopicus]
MGIKTPRHAPRFQGVRVGSPGHPVTAVGGADSPPAVLFDIVDGIGTPTEGEQREAAKTTDPTRAVSASGRSVPGVMPHRP